MNEQDNEGERIEKWREGSSIDVFVQLGDHRLWRKVFLLLHFLRLSSCPLIGEPSEEQINEEKEAC